MTMLDYIMEQPEIFRKVLAPVSYTHLDVYKRQGLSLLMTIALLAGGTVGCSGKTDTPAPEPEKQTEAQTEKQAETEAPKQEETAGEEKLKVGILLKTLASEY